MFFAYDPLNFNTINMKQFKFTLVLILISMITGISSLKAQDSTDPIKQVRELEPFERIVAANGVNVKLFDNQLEEAEIHVSGIPLENVITEVEGRTLKVRLKVSVKNTDATILVKVSYKQLTSLSATTGARIESGRKLTSDIIKMSVSAGGVINAELDAKEVDVSAKAGSEIQLFGKTDKLKASAALGGFVKAYKLIAKSVTASSSGGSYVEVFAMEEANLKASLGGDVKVKGSPYEVKEKANTGGVIKILNKPEHGKDLIRDE